MGLREDLTNDVAAIFRSAWDVTEKQSIPLATDLRLGNHAGHFEEMTVLYADLDGSTAMVDKLSWSISAEVYKAYLHCAAKLIKDEGGTITAYDGDRIMAVFIGHSKNTSAVRCALKINTLVNDVINPTFRTMYGWSDLTIGHSIGIDASEIHAARIGVKNDNDIVWVGRAANHAAKLTTLPDYPIWITDDVYRNMNDSLRTYAGSGLQAWEARNWLAMNNRVVYRTSAQWNLWG